MALHSHRPLAFSNREAALNLQLMESSDSRVCLNLIQQESHCNMHLSVTDQEEATLPPTFTAPHPSYVLETNEISGVIRNIDFLLFKSEHHNHSRYHYSSNMSSHKHSKRSHRQSSHSSSSRSSHHQTTQVSQGLIFITSPSQWLQF